MQHDRGAEKIRAFLTYLAVDRHVAASTQHGALHALVFLYRSVLCQEFPERGEIPRARKPRRLPTVFAPEDAHAVLAELSGAEPA